MKLHRWLLALPLLLAAAPALAQGEHGAIGTDPLAMWEFSPGIIIGLLLVSWIYWRGSRGGQVEKRWRTASYFGGLFALFLALISPIEPLADHVFAVHQVEHILLGTVAPMLIFLSQPQASFAGGLPPGALRFFGGRSWLRAPVAFLRLPPVATAIFLFASIFWMIPKYHDMSILDEPFHHLWHISLVLTGLIFFSVVFGRHPPSHGPGLVPRLAMLAFAALGNIVLGAFLTFKSVPLYHAYAALGHLWQVPMLTDEQAGGIIMWIPGSMMFAISALIVLYGRGGEEDRVTGQRASRSGAPAVGNPANRMVAFVLGACAVLMLLIAISVVALIDHPPGGQHAFGMAGEIPG